MTHPATETTGAVSIKLQTASEDYECDGQCDIPIPEETLYVRVATLREGTASALYGGGIQKFHPDCYAKLPEGRI